MVRLIFQALSHILIEMRLGTVYIFRKNKESK